MAKRAAPDEKPYRPLLDADLVNAVIASPSPMSRVTAPSQPARVFEMPRMEPPRGQERADADGKADDVDIAEDGLRPTVHALVEKFDQEKRILFTRAESQAIDRLVTSLAARLSTQVKVSHVVRALIGLMLHAEGQIDRRAGESGPLVRPPNGDAIGLQRFEREIGRILASGIRDAGPVP